MYIESDQITVSAAAASVAEVNINIAAANTSLIIDGVTLDVQGQFNVTNTGNNFDGTVSVINGGTLAINDNATFDRQGGANAFGLTLSEASRATINKNLELLSSGGSAADNLFT